MQLDRTMKCVVVGDGAVGKTCLLISYSSNRFPKEYVPTVFDHYAVTVEVAGKPFTLALFDTAGQEEYDKLRLLTYPGTDVFLVCFSVTSPDSFHNLHHTWVPEIKQYCPNAPFLIVGTQCDLRDDPVVLANLRKQKQEMVSTDKGQKLARQMNAVGYVECSALTQKNVRELFNEAILTAVQPPKKRRKKGISKLNCLSKTH